ncbi:hypothetical protein CHS0354_004965 [Potamilus streckersoni]|uniref:Uncharacterized protein n=1 Tax=Potamilus streckersoni TaxID=2493646 RepID=A0AAE0RNL2_9BIVA|nr:hypothetical protein CHS0354_004965 [Potamilus streckersoni]
MFPFFACSLTFLHVPFLSCMFQYFFACSLSFCMLSFFFACSLTFLYIPMFLFSLYVLLLFWMFSCSLAYFLSILQVPLCFCIFSFFFECFLSFFFLRLAFSLLHLSNMCSLIFSLHFLTSLFGTTPMDANNNNMTFLIVL